jgi:hypothetical protein
MVVIILLKVDDEGYDQGLCMAQYLLYQALTSYSAGAQNAQEVFYGICKYI